MARSISVRRLNQQTSAVLADVASGESMTITSDGRPVATLTAVAAGPFDQLIAGGLMNPASIAGPITLPDRTPHSDVDIAADIAREREEAAW